MSAGPRRKTGNTAAVASAVVIAAIAIAACGPPPEPIAKPPPTATTARPDPNAPAITLFPQRAAEPVATTPFGKGGVIAPSNESLSKWVEAPLAEEPPTVSPRVVAAGIHAAIVRRGAQLFAVHDQRGVTGPIALPEGTFWIGLDGADALYAARPNGELLRAGDLAKALDPAGFEPIVTIPSAVAWDVTERSIVAAGAGFVFTSTDRGAAFRYAALPQGQAPAQITARSDGAIAIVAHEGGDARRPSVWLASDRSPAIRPSSFQPRSVRREGARISGQQGSCEGYLASDGATWIAEGGASAYEHRSAWERWLDLWSWPAARRSSQALSLRAPSAPERSSASPALGPDGKCPERRGRGGLGALGGIGGVVGGLVGGVLGGVGGRDGVLPIARTMPWAARRSRTTWSFLADGACEGESTWGGSIRCKPGQTVTRLPRVARLDREAITLDLVDAPAGCAPDGLENVRGTAILACAAENGNRAVYTAGRDGRWYAEGSIACTKDLHVFDSKGDGTLALICPESGEGASPIWVRRPESLGTAGAFRKVAVPGAIAYRLLDAGRAVAVTTRGKPPADLGGLRGIALGGSSGSLGGASTGKGAGGAGKKGRPGSGAPTGTKTAPAGAKTAPTGAKTSAPTPAKKDDPAAVRERHTFSVVLDTPDSGQTVMAKDLHVSDDITAFATTDSDVYFRVEKHESAWATSPSDEKQAAAARYFVLENKRLRDIPPARAPSDIVLRARDRQESALSGSLSLSLALPAPSAIAADGTHVYWTDSESGQLLRVAKSGGASEVLASGLSHPLAVAVDEARVFFTTLGGAYGEPGTVGFVPKSGGAVTLLAEGLLRPLALVADSAAVYWLSQGLERSATGALHRYPKDGSPPTVLLSRLASPQTLALGGDRLFVSSGFGDVLSVPSRGGSAARVTSRGSPATSLLVLGDNLLFSTRDDPSIASAPLTSGPATRTFLAHGTESLLSGTAGDLWLAGAFDDKLSHTTSLAERPAVVTSDLRSATAILADDTGIYVREGSGQLLRRFTRKGTPVVLHERKDK